METLLACADKRACNGRKNNIITDIRGNIDIELPEIHMMNRFIGTCRNGPNAMFQLRWRIRCGSESRMAVAGKERSTYPGGCFSSGVLIWFGAVIRVLNMKLFVNIYIYIYILRAEIESPFFRQKAENAAFIKRNTRCHCQHLFKQADSWWYSLQKIYYGCKRPSGTTEFFFITYVLMEFSSLSKRLFMDSKLIRLSFTPENVKSVTNY